jgi:copper resistance protein D
MGDPMTMSMPVSHLLIGSFLRAMELIPLVLLVGWQAFLVMVLRPDTVALLGGDGQETMMRFDRRVTVGALTLILAAMAAGFVHESAMMSRRPVAELGPMVWPILTKTHFGRVMIGRMIIWAGFLLAWRLRTDSPDSMAKGRGMLLGLGALWCLTRSLSGHSADHGDWSMDVLVDWLHLLAVSFWAGGVMVLALLTPAWLRQCDAEAAGALLIRLLQRFSPLAMCCVAVLVAAGLFSAHKRGVALFMPFESNYGQLVAFKVGLTALAVGLGGISKFIVLPTLRRNPGRGDASTIGRFRRMIRVEACLLVLAVLTAAVLTQTPPAGDVSLTSGPMIHRPMPHAPKEPPPSSNHGNRGNHGDQGNKQEEHAMPGMPGM